MSIRLIDISQLKAEDWAIKLAQKQTLDVPETYFNEEDCILYFILLTTIERAKSIKESENNVHIVKYSEDLNGIVFGFTPARKYTGKRINDAMESGVIGLVKINDYVAQKVLIRLSEGVGQIFYLTVSEDYAVVSAKQILTSQMGKDMIKIAVQNAGLIR